MSRRPTCLVAVAALLIGGCGDRGTDTDSAESTTPAVQQYPNWPTLLNEFRFHWSASPGIDVTTGPAMVVRAYMEAYDTAWFTLDANNVFPGFQRATPENRKPEGEFLWQQVHVRPLGSGYPRTAEDARPHFGYQELHFLELEPIGRSAYRALVCSGEYAHFVESRTQIGKFVSIGVNEETARPYHDGTSGVFPYRIELVQQDESLSPDETAVAAEPQRGPAPAPHRDVFGNWFITGASSSNWGPSTQPAAATEFPSAALKQRCEDAMPTPRADRLAMMTGFKDSPPPHGNAEPGWPAEAP